MNISDINFATLTDMLEKLIIQFTIRLVNLVNANIPSAEAALHCVAALDSKLPPHRDSRSRLLVPLKAKLAQR